MAYTTREFKRKHIVTLDQLLDMQYGQLQARERFAGKLSDNALQTRLGAVTGVLAILFWKATTFSVATSIASLILSSTTSEKKALTTMIDAGYIGLGSAIQFLRDPKYDRLEIELPFLEYRDFHTLDLEIALITGRGRVTRVHAKTGWIPL
ncbi:hypothetical protein [Ornithinibacillus xuwenensis]|uniref:Uncharacterized protein n=1 Tax=Ornithinibacillus xuwenensis TaxID=3144668 RepID=A0ABU9XGF3_9BACI